MLASSPSFTQTIIISIITSGVVATAVAGAFRLVEQSREHGHERNRQIREERKAIYPAAVDVIAQLTHNLAQLELHGPQPSGSVVVDESERRDLALQMAVFASPEVYALFGQFFVAAKSTGSASASMPRVGSSRQARRRYACSGRTSRSRVATYAISKIAY